MMIGSETHRLTQSTLQLDLPGLRSGFYSDRYFTNVAAILNALSQEGYHYAGQNPRGILGAESLAVGDAFVEAQIFNRRSPIAVIAGIDVALTMLRHASGFFDPDGQFVETWDQLQVDAVRDGDITYYDGDPEDVLTVIEIRGRYKDFAILETPILGVLSRASRIATNTYEVLQVSNGKPVLFFPARFDILETQKLDGYAYWLAVQRYNAEYHRQVQPAVSTHANAAWWGGLGSGTVPHALIACFLADDVEAMRAFAQHMPVETPRILLADFNNDTVAASRATLAAFWPQYLQAYKQGDSEGMRRWSLHGVRLDTSATLRDRALDADDPKGVNPVLVRTVRSALNSAWESWDLDTQYEDVAREFCRSVQIIVSGGFNRDKVETFERARTPVDAYGVGSSLLNNARDTNTDFTMDVVRIRIAGHWVDIAKVGRRPCDNPDLRRVDLNLFE